jgi:heptose-I-phosphate ethanolaminephosphotransferase
MSDRIRSFRALRVAAIALVLVAMLAAAHDARRLGQVLVLAAPPLLWLLWPLRSVLARRARAIAAWGWTTAFVVDAAVRGYLMSVYQAAPNSSMVVSSVANTVDDEAFEYLSLAWPAILPWAAAAAACALALFALLHAELRADLPAVSSGATARPSVAARRLRVGLALAAVLPVAAAYAIKPWRRLHPAVFWSRWADEVDAERLGWADRHRWRDATLERARAEGAATDATSPSTVVLVLTDSVNRDNLGLYGYPRDTTPQLELQQAALGDALVVFRDAWSTHAGTIPAVRSLFQFGADAPDATAHLLSLARAAGWRSWWLSTHDDIAIEQIHARLADTVHMASRTPGRASRTPDGALIDPLRAALADPAPLKLVVLHMMGAHPHYRFRYPAGDNPFDDVEDEVARALERNGRPFWIRAARDHYDAALRHHDRVVAQTLEFVRAHVDEGRHGAWMYLSDHGQEVGHQIDHAGHSAATEAGYRIPAMLWRSHPRRRPPEALDARPFRGDWAAWTLAHLLELRWAGADGRRDVLSDAYRWVPPTIPYATAQPAQSTRGG